MDQILKNKIENMLADEFCCTLEELNGKTRYTLSSPIRTSPSLRYWLTGIV